MLPANRLFFAQLKDLRLGEGCVEAERAGDGLVRLRSTGYSYFCRLVADRPGVKFSQNYVDLRDGDVVDIRVTGLPSDATLSVASWGREATNARR